MLSLVFSDVENRLIISTSIGSDYINISCLQFRAWYFCFDWGMNLKSYRVVEAQAETSCISSFITPTSTSHIKTYLQFPTWHQNSYLSLFSLHFCCCRFGLLGARPHQWRRDTSNGWRNSAAATKMLRRRPWDSKYLRRTPSSSTRSMLPEIVLTRSPSTSSPISQTMNSCRLEPD